MKQLLPPPGEVRKRLSQAVREAALLRRQLRLSERAAADCPECVRPANEQYGKLVRR